MSNMNYLTPHTIAARFIEQENLKLALKDQAKLLGISRASLYYSPRPIDSETLDLLNKVDKIHTDWPVYGARKIAEQLKIDHKKEYGETLIIGRKRVRSLMEEMGIEAIYPKPNLSFNNKPHPIFPYLLSGVKIIRPNHVWGADITYIRLRGSFCYLVAFLDWYSRYVLSWGLSTTLETQFVLDAARDAMKNYGNPDIANVDQGVQFTNENFIGLWNPERTKISMDHRGRCFDNIFTERLWRTLKYEEVYLKDYETVWEAERNIEEYINRYNNERLHQALEYKTPAEIYFAN